MDIIHRAAIECKVVQIKLIKIFRRAPIKLLNWAFYYNKFGVVLSQIIHPTNKYIDDLIPLKTIYHLNNFLESIQLCFHEIAK